MLFETDDVVFEIFSPKKLATLVKSRRSPKTLVWQRSFK
jgi:ribosomal protein L24E